MTASRPLTDGARLAVFVSGNGSNLQAVIDACADGRLPATVAVVVSNNAEAYALERARAAGIPTEVRPHAGRDRAAYDQELAYTVATYGADLVVLAGWNRILTSHFVGHHTTINLHPAKPGGFRGLGAIEADFTAWQRGERSEGGVMVHYVPDEGVDDGPVIAWEAVPFHDGDTLDRYADRVHATEHRLLVDSLATLLEAPTAGVDTIGGRT
ncbi:MAG: phosphoribosylglycinamide formyltransferase [Actinomycetota bacterium]